MLLDLDPAANFIIEMPILIKAIPNSSGKRLISFEASCEEVDLEGDLCSQQALLDSTDSFLKGFIDLEHLGCIGSRYGLNPNDFIIGRPTRVFDMGGGRTGVEGELFSGHPKADHVWVTLTKANPESWKSSIYALPKPGGIISAESLPESERQGATRYIIKAVEWQSIALTKTPVNNKIKDTVKIVKSEAFLKAMDGKIDEVLKSYNYTDVTLPGPMINNVAAGLQGPDFGQVPTNNPHDGNQANSHPQIQHMFPPRSREELHGHYHGHIALGKCKHAGGKNPVSTATLRDHFMKCAGMDYHAADIHALATQYMLRRH